MTFGMQKPYLWVHARHPCNCYITLRDDSEGPHLLFSCFISMWYTHNSCFYSITVQLASISAFQIFMSHECTLHRYLQNT